MPHHDRDLYPGVVRCGTMDQEVQDGTAPLHDWDATEIPDPEQPHGIAVQRTCTVCERYEERCSCGELLVERGAPTVETNHGDLCLWWWRGG